MPSIKSMTKAQLIAHIAELDAQLIERGRALEALRLELSVAKATAQAQAKREPAGDKPLPATFDDYYAYVRAARKWCYAAGRPVSYASREQFAEAHHGVAA